MTESAQPNQQRLLEHATASLESGNLQQAIAMCRELNTSFPDCIDGWRLATQIHFKLKKPEAALFSTQKILASCPDDIDAALQRIDSLLSLEHRQEAMDLALSLASTAKTSADGHDQIGRRLASLHLHEAALIQYEMAHAIDPENPMLIYNIATAQRFLGMLVEAENSLDRVLHLNKFDYEAQAMRSSLRRQTTADNHVNELKGLLDEPALDPLGVPNICYALGKELDDLDEPAASFHYLKRGAESRKQRLKYKVETDLRIIDAIRNCYGHQFFSSRPEGHDSCEPVFIIGMPRTGTSLVERILGSHPDVFAAGELDNFGREMMRQIADTGGLSKLSRIEVVERARSIDVARLGRDYIASTRPFTGDKPHFIDKLPFNYLYAGLIHAALPHARIINLARHPMATCYAVFKQFFRDAYPFSYDLSDVARYFVAYHRLMQHWNTVMPGTIHTLWYEDVVTDTEAEARKLLDFCGLPWDSGVLNFHKNRMASTTASASQVRQPVYRGSVDRWRAYETELAPVADILISAGIDISA